MPRVGDYRYKLEIGALSSETPADEIETTDIVGGTIKVGADTFTFTLTKTAGSQSISLNDDVRFYERHNGEVGWGETTFWGYVKAREFKTTEDEIAITCCSMEQKMIDERTLKDATFGRKHNVDVDLEILHVQNVSGTVDRIYTTLPNGATSPPPYWKVNTPLESIKALRMNEAVLSGNNPGLSQVLNNTLPIPDVYRHVAQSFIARPGGLRKTWFAGLCIGTDLTPDPIEICIYSDAVNRYGPGTLIEQQTIPYNQWRQVLIGLYTWADAEIIEWDWLANTTTPQNLELSPGHQYWIVWSMRPWHSSGVLRYELMGFQQDPSLPRRCMTLDSTGAAFYVNDPVCQSLFYAMDFASDWKEVDDMNYIAETNVYPVPVFFERNNTLITDVGGSGPGIVNHEDNFPDSFLYVYNTPINGTTSLRASWWEREMDIQALMTEWAQMVASDLYDILSVSVSTPSSAPIVLHFENAKAWDLVKEVRKYTPIVVRFFVDGAGNRTLEIVDEVEIADWAGLGAGDQAARTFSHGNEAGADSEIRIVDDGYSEELVSSAAKCMLVNAQGKIVGVMGEGDTIAMVRNDGLELGSRYDGIKFTQAKWEEIVQTKWAGYVKLSGIDRSIATDIYRHANDLIKIQHAGAGLNTVFSLSSIAYTWSIDEGMDLQFTLSDRLVSSIPDGLIQPWANPYELLQYGMFGMLRDMINPSNPAYKQTGEVSGRGTMGAPTNQKPPAGAVERSMMPVAFEDPRSLIHNPALTYWIRVGTGSPIIGAAALVNQVADAQASVDIISVGGVDYAYISTYLNGDAFPKPPTWPYIISEVGLATSIDPTAPRIAIAAYALGDPQGTFEIWCPQHEMAPHKRLGIFIRLDTPP